MTVNNNSPSILKLADAKIKRISTMMELLGDEELIFSPERGVSEAVVKEGCLLLVWRGRDSWKEPSRDSIAFTRARSMKQIVKRST